MAVYLCYVDESGDTEAAAANPDPRYPPAFVLTGLVLPRDALRSLTTEFLALKCRYFPGLMKSVGHHLDSALIEVKSTDLKTSVRRGTRRDRSTAIGFLDRIFDLLELHNARLIGRVWIKKPADPLDGRAMYTFSIQDICSHFQALLQTVDAEGCVIADSREHQLDQTVAHSLFTLKHKLDGDPLERIIEVPVFGRSGNHVGLQLADLVGGLVLAITTRVYCIGMITGPHVHANYDILRSRYSQRLMHLQFRYQKETGGWTGGLVVADHYQKRPGSLLFSPPPS